MTAAKEHLVTCRAVLSANVLDALTSAGYLRNVGGSTLPGSERRRYQLALPAESVREALELLDAFLRDHGVSDYDLEPGGES
jgi:hypothetical protein